MKNWLLRGLLGLTLFIAAVTCVLWALPFITNLETTRNQVAMVASATLQRRVTLERLSLRAIPSPGLQIADLAIAERNGSPIVAVEQLVTEVKLAPLLDRKVVVNRILVEQPHITLTRRADGSLNLPLPPAGKSQPAKPGTAAPDDGVPLMLALEEARIQNGDATIRDGQKQHAPPLLRLQGLDLMLEDVSLAPAPARPGPDAAPPINRLTAGGTLAAKMVATPTATAENLRADLSIKAGVARLDNIALALFGGKGHGWLVADMGKVPQRMGSNMTLTALHMQKVVQAAQPASATAISGTASLQGTLAMHGTSPDEIMRTLTGTARFEIKDGTIRKMETLGKILSILNLKRLFSGTLPDMSRDGVPFDLISGTLQFKNGLMTTDDLSLKGPAVDVAVKGTARLPDKQVAMVVTALGMDFDVQGPVDNPTVSSRAAKGIQQGVGSLLEKGLGLFR